jgi:hypothetical protein
LASANLASLLPAGLAQRGRIMAAMADMAAPLDHGRALKPVYNEPDAERSAESF